MNTRPVSNQPDASRRMSIQEALKLAAAHQGAGRLAQAETVLRQMLLEKTFGAAGDEVLIEERIVGPEASVLAFSDGERLAIMPVAQDHKRVGDGDTGPNTGVTTGAGA